MTRPIPFVAALVLIGTSVGVAQQKRVVTTADYDRAVKMLAPALNGLVVGDSVNADLAAGRPLLVRPHDADRHRERRHRSGEEDARDGGDAAGRRSGRAGRGRPRRARRRRRSRRRRSRRRRAHRRRAAPTSRALTGPPPPSMSPDGTKALFICDWNLWVRDVATGQDRQLTTDGVKDFGYATSNAGWTTSAAPVAVVVARRQEDRDAAAGRAQGRRHVPGRDAGQRRPSGPARVEVSAPRRSGRRDDQPRHHRRRDRQDDAPADGAGFPPRDVRRQHRHGRVPLEPGRVEARVRLDRSVSQELHRQARRHRRPAKSARSSPRPRRRTCRRACSGRSSGTPTKSSGTRSATAPRRCISTISRPAS